MTPFTIYLWQQVDVLHAALGIFLGVGSVVYATISFAGWVDHDITPKKWPLYYLVPMFVVFIFIPSSKTIAMMVAIPAIANSEPIQKDLPELYQLAKDALKEQITGKSTK